MWGLFENVRESATNVRESVIRSMLYLGDGRRCIGGGHAGALEGEARAECGTEEGGRDACYLCGDLQILRYYRSLPVALTRGEVELTLSSVYLGVCAVGDPGLQT